MDGTVGCVIIGRNEGERLVKCLASAQGATDQIVYVDSGSTDGSGEAARAAGATVVDLDLSRPFTAARARNEGVARLAENGLPEFIQFVDGDCELRDGWIGAARDFLHNTPGAAVAFGRRRERFPEASVYNRLADWEWDVPPGEQKYCGGDTLMRASAFDAVGGFDPGLIAGEEPELCVRLRAAGWTIHCLDHEMTWHDAAMTRFGQWWKRARRAGHAYAEGARLHGGAPERHKVAETRRAFFWGAAPPGATLALALVATPWALLLLAAYPAQVLRLARNDRSPGTWQRAFFLTLSRIPEAIGALEFHIRNRLGRKSALIEYK